MPRNFCVRHKVDTQPPPRIVGQLFVHRPAGGRIVRSGGKELALELEVKGYDWIKAEPVAAQ